MPKRAEPFNPKVTGAAAVVLVYGVMALLLTVTGMPLFLALILSALAAIGAGLVVTECLERKSADRPVARPALTSTEAERLSALRTAAESGLPFLDYGSGEILTPEQAQRALGALMAEGLPTQGRPRPDVVLDQAMLDELARLARAGLHRQRGLGHVQRQRAQIWGEPEDITRFAAPGYLYETEEIHAAERLEPIAIIHTDEARVPPTPEPVAVVETRSDGWLVRLGPGRTVGITHADRRELDHLRTSRVGGDWVLPSGEIVSGGEGLMILDAINGDSSATREHLRAAAGRRERTSAAVAEDINQAYRDHRRGLISLSVHDSLVRELVAEHKRALMRERTGGWQ